MLCSYNSLRHNSTHHSAQYLAIFLGFHLNLEHRDGHVSPSFVLQSGFPFSQEADVIPCIAAEVEILYSVFEWNADFRAARPAWAGRWIRAECSSMTQRQSNAWLWLADSSLCLFLGFIQVIVIQRSNDSQSGFYLSRVMLWSYAINYHMPYKYI